MPSENIKQIIMRRDNMPEQEANDLLVAAFETFDEYLKSQDMQAAEDICEEFFGLELDYLPEFLVMKNAYINRRVLPCA